MQLALLDTSVLFGATYRRDSTREDAEPILRGVDDGTLPEAVVIDYVLAETLNSLTNKAGHDAAVDFLRRVESNVRFNVETITRDTFAAAKAEFRRHEPFSFVDACLVAHARATDLTYLYSFDDDFEAVDGITRLETPDDPRA